MALIIHRLHGCQCGSTNQRMEVWIPPPLLLTRFVYVQDTRMALIRLPRFILCESKIVKLRHNAAEMSTLLIAVGKSHLKVSYSMANNYLPPNSLVSVRPSLLSLTQ